MPSLPATDEWVVASTSSTADQQQLASPASTPTKRASRSSRISNNVDYAAFARTTEAASIEFRVGDTVIIDHTPKLGQKFLAPPPYLVQKKKQKQSKKGKGKRRAVPMADAGGDDSEVDDDDEVWKHEDGLKAGEKVGIITRLYEDERGRKMALVRWFARPGAVWGPDGPEADEDAGPVLPYELYYTSDSTHLSEARILRQRATANPFSSPSASPSKRSRNDATASPARSGSLQLSSAALFRTPQHSDPVPVTAIVSHAEVFSPDTLPDLNITASQQRPLPTFLCRTVYDVKPIPGAGFWGGLNWDEHREKAVKSYHRLMEEKESGRAVDGWDVEAVMEESEEEEDDEVERERARRSKAAKERAWQREKQRQQASANTGGSKTKRTAKAKAASSESDSSSEAGESSDAHFSSDDDEEDDSLVTPTKKHRSQQLLTPSSSGTRKRGRSSIQTSPTEKVPPVKRRKVQQRKKKKNASAPAIGSGSSHNPLPPLLQAAHLESLTPFERAKALLHVSATPEALPCREEQREQIRSFLEDSILGRSGGCLYIHGVPGTGKTATVHSVVRELQNDEDMDGFTFVEINGMKISEPMAAFSHLWQALAPADSLGSRKTSPKAALAALENHFANPDPARKTTVVLVDELDQMLTKRQDVLYNFFNWPHVAHSRLVVLAVANTMDLPERELSGKIRSRLGTNRIPFQPYTWTELKRILEARLSLVADPNATGASKTKPAVPLFDDVALQKIAKSVAGISGDARKALDVARRTLDRVALRLTKESSESESGRPRGADALLAKLERGEIKCTIQDATQAYNDMTRQGPAAFVRRCSTMGKVLLLAVAQCVRRAGVPEVELDTVLSWHLDFLRQTSLCPASASPTKHELVGLVAQLHALRLLTAESQRLDVFQRVRSGVDEGDLFAALREDEELMMHVPKVI
ncbi:Origin recognition complex, subunit 1 [Rhodotorula mucilaginosa]|uniref:Origin recognition complex subunit 1 n=1 Tax=Rhodotorula mucilaginosa TaxID=5537 RepID=A0A9P6W6B3_RHOMI|nr:Origin recognition complex, subunit 1 [Rhodotorula mucilaginosa]